MKEVNPKGKHPIYDDDKDKRSNIATNDSPREAQLDDIVYGYGGEEVIRHSGANTPVHVLRAYKELCLLRKRCDDVINLCDPLMDDREIDSITINSINTECFQFIQSLLSKWNDAQLNSLQPFGGHLSL